MLLTIEKLIYGGDGLARLPADEAGRGKAVFIPFVLPGETIEARIVEQKPGFARARAESVVEPSPHRIAPACPHFAACGGCHYQHTSYEHQLEIKSQILRETLQRTAKLELRDEIQIHASPPWNYRNRSRFQILTKPAFKAGYFKLASHEVLAVEQCPISSPLINRGLAILWGSGREGKVPEGVREVEFFANADDSQLLLDVYCASTARRAAVRVWGEEMRELLPEIAGVVAFRESDPKARKAAPEKLAVVGNDHLVYQVGRASYRVSAGSFFQTNRHLTEELVKVVTHGQSGSLALDLYAGVGLFSTALAGDIRHIVSVESSPTSTADLAYNLPASGKAVQATTEQYLIGASSEKLRPDLVVVDPPRNGLGERVAKSLAALSAPRVTYVSCDPATLARDLVTLLAAGYRIEQLHLFDLFPQTFHLESVLQLVR